MEKAIKTGIYRIWRVETAILIIILLLIGFSPVVSKSYAANNSGTEGARCENAQKDCQGNCFGLAFVDACGSCTTVRPLDTDSDGTPDYCDECPTTSLGKDLCDVCGGDNSSCAGCDGVPHSGLVDDECGVCGGDGDTCGECQYYTGYAVNRRKRDWKYHYKRMFTSADGNATANEVEFLPCVQKWIKQADDYVRPDGRHHRNRYRYDRSDRRKHVVMVYEKNGNNFDSMIRDFFADLAREAGTLGENQRLTNNVHYEFLMDKDCNPVPLNSVPEGLICGSFTVAAMTSPISLLWDGATELSGDRSIVSFQLDPTKSGKSYGWKGSATAPLLVFDPSGTGEVASAAQLFGNYTFFNGVTTASLRGLDYRPQKVWENGFQALATLDLNGDGKISDNELAPISLWFDRNRDGVSQVGEVMSASDVGLTTLYYEVDYTDSETGDIYITNGFERVKDGQTTQGVSVDWYGEQADSPTELLAKFSARGLLDSSEASGSEEDRSPEISAYKPISHPLNGIWEWNVTSSSVEFGKDESHVGFLFLQASADGSVQGHSLIESPVLGKTGKLTLHSYLFGASLFGMLTPKVGGQDILNFKIKGKGAQTTTSKATLDDSGIVLNGESIMTNKGKQRVHYNWRAEKLATPGLEPGTSEL